MSGKVTDNFERLFSKKKKNISSFPDLFTWILLVSNFCIFANKMRVYVRVKTNLIITLTQNSHPNINPNPNGK